MVSILLGLLPNLAASRGWLDIIKDLITKYKFDINCKGSYGRTPLHYAARNKTNGGGKVLVINEQNCDPMTRDNDGGTPLHIACRYGHLNITQYLINEAHCNPLCENNDGDTPLHYACKYGNTRIVQCLLSTGKVDPLAKNKNGDTPMYKQDDESILPLLHLAASRGWVDMCHIRPNNKVQVRHQL